MMISTQRGGDITVCHSAKPKTNPTRQPGLRPAADRNVCPTRRRAARRSRRGFTLAEVLISIGIFAIGMIAVASLFPVAAILQKETADDILGQQSANNARATIEAIGLTYIQGDGNTDLGEYHTTPASNANVVVPIGNLATTAFFNHYNLSERSYPSTEAVFDERDHYWFFYVRDSAGNAASPNWQGFLIIAEREDDQTFADVDADLDFGVPTDQNTPYITIDGKTGTWDLNNPPTITAPASGFVYFHPEGIAVETFSFDTVAP